MKNLVLILVLILIGCGKTTNNPATYASTVTNTTSTITEAASLSDIQQIVANENAYRASISQELLLPGLTCYLYTVPQTTTAIVGATLTSIGQWAFNGIFDQTNESTSNGLNILPTNLQGFYQNWYIVKCIGLLVVADDNWHSFDLTSDDGSNLYIDGLLINNDGLHGANKVMAAKFLKWGIHSFELDFLQANGNEALILNQDGQLMGNTGFYH